MESPDRKFADPLSAEKEVVRRYFHEVLDRGKVEVIEELFHPECVMHRPGGTVIGIDSVRGVAERRAADPGGLCRLVVSERLHVGDLRQPVPSG